MCSRPGARFPLLVGAAVCAALSFVRLDVPPIWYDEGWVLSVARNWVERRHYGLLLSGNPVPADIVTTGWPAIAPIAMSFRLFGIGLVQGRIPGLLFALGTLCLLYYLTRSLYDGTTAVAAVVVALLLPALPQLHPVLLGRQVLGEMPALFFLFSGYLLFLRSWKTPLWLLPAGLLWALALTIKPQVLPFFVVSVTIPALLLGLRQAFQPTLLLVAGSVAALGSGVVLTLVGDLLTGTRGLGNPANDAYALLGSRASLTTYVLTLMPYARGNALYMVLIGGLPTLSGLLAFGVRLVRRKECVQISSRTVGRLMIWSFASGWFLWFLFLSIGWPRYLFPALFAGSIPLAAFLRRHTDGFNPQIMARRAAKTLSCHPRTLGGVVCLGAVVALPIALALNLQAAFILLSAPVDHSAAEMALFISEHTSDQAMIETYDSELFFFLDQPYHYPPDYVQTQLNQRMYLGRSDIVIDYDPLAADPDFVVIGPFSRGWRLYDEVLRTDVFHPLHTVGAYDLYERVR